MISAISTPVAGAVLLDANNTVISIQSTNGVGFYFRAVIKIDGSVFDEQSWSRSDAYTASKDIKKIYNAYFASVFNDAFNQVLQEHIALKKRVSITINEYSLATGNVVQTVDLPEFYIMYNIKPVAFNDAAKIKLLGMDAAVMVIPRDGKIAVPFYVNATNEAVNVTLTTATGNTIVSEGVASFTGKKVYLFKYSLAPTPVAYGTTHLTLTITVGGSVESVVYRINHLPDYPFKQIAFRNNFGFYLYAYPDGELDIADALDVDSYEQEDGSETVMEINEESTYTINTGSYRSNEKGIMSMIANSPDVWLIDSESGSWLRLLPQTKKLNSFTDRKHVYNNDLTFKVYKDADVSNTGLAVVPLYPDIYITQVFEEKHQIEIYFTLNNGFVPNQGAIEVQIRAAGATIWEPLIYTTTPETGLISFSISQYPAPVIQLRLIDYQNPAIASNVVSVVLT